MEWNDKEEKEKQLQELIEKEQQWAINNCGIW